MNHLFIIIWGGIEKKIIPVKEAMHTIYESIYIYNPYLLTPWEGC